MYRSSKKKRSCRVTETRDGLKTKNCKRPTKLVKCNVRDAYGLNGLLSQRRNKKTASPGAARSKGTRSFTFVAGHGDGAQNSRPPATLRRSTR